jgi:hypothetical protein
MVKGNRKNKGDLIVRQFKYSYLLTVTNGIANTSGEIAALGATSNAGCGLLNVPSFLAMNDLYRYWRLRKFKIYTDWLTNSTSTFLPGYTIWFNPTGASLNLQHPIDTIHQAYGVSNGIHIGRPAELVVPKEVLAANFPWYDTQDDGGTTEAEEFGVIMFTCTDGASAQDGSLYVSISFEAEFKTQTDPQQLSSLLRERAALALVKDSAVISQKAPYPKGQVPWAKPKL